MPGISVRRMRWNGSMPSRRTSRRCATRVLTSARVSRKSSCWVACHCVPARRSNGTDQRWLREIVLRRRPLYGGKTVQAGLFPDLLILGNSPDTGEPPATVSQLPDGRVRLDYWNDRPEAVDVLLKAKRRVSGELGCSLRVHKHQSKQ